MLSLSILQFWSCHPALLYGIAFLLGLSCHFNASLWLVLPCLSLWLPLLRVAINPRYRDALKPLALSGLLFLTAWGFAAVHYVFPQLTQEISGQALVKIKAISLQHSLFGERWLYRCELQQFFPENSTDSIASSLPCVISLPSKYLEKESRPLANQDYWLLGRLTQTEQGSYVLKVSSKTSWTPVPASWNLAEQRYQWKKKMADWIESQFSHSASASFLAGLVTGEFDDFWMRQQFARFGLQHLLAISGFHFAIVAGFLSFILRLFLSQRVRILTLLIGLAIYCLFLGPQASILRAWIMCSLALLVSLIDKSSSALNSLGLAILMILGYNPLLCQELGFQLSFTTTAAILLFYQPARTWLYELFPKRELSDALKMNHLSQYGYCLVAFLREGLALTVAVNIFALPLTLYYFNQFPWMSLLFNLFFPFLASASLCLLMIGALLTFVPFIPELIHHLNDAYTYFLLQMTYQVPLEMDSYLLIEVFHPFWLILYLCCASLGGIIWKERKSVSSQEAFLMI